MSLPIVAIIGRPNVGKSTLFNRLVGFRKAVVSPTPGTTRDRNYARITGRSPYLLVDTGGIEESVSGVIKENIVRQAKIAIADASLILFMVDVKEPISPDDIAVAGMLRKSGKSVILIISKCDSMQEDISDFYSLGFGDPLRISSVHYLGVDDLEKKIKKQIPKTTLEKTKEKEVKLAIVGRPNVGKSSLINRFAGEEKVIVSEIPGTTVDATDIEIKRDDKKFILVDTAGIRKRGKRGEEGVEKYSFMRSIQAVQGADVSVLLLDSPEGITAQDQHIAQYILDECTGLILALNKSDLLEEKGEDSSALLRRLQYRFQFAPWAPVVVTSAKTGKNINHILDLAGEIKETRSVKIEQAKLESWLDDTVYTHPPSGVGVKIPKFFAMSQTASNPPTFEITCTNERFIHFSYRRYLENKFRETFGFEGTGIKFLYKNRLPKR